jgi:hypothetical protein
MFHKYHSNLFSLELELSMGLTQNYFSLVNPPRFIFSSQDRLNNNRAFDRLRPLVVPTQSKTITICSFQSYKQCTALVNAFW